MPRVESVAVDMAAAEEGKWFEYPGSGLKYRLAWAGREQVQHEIDMAAISGNTGYEENLRIWGGMVVKGWNHDDEHNKPIPYSPEAFVKTFADPSLAHVFRWIRNTSARVEPFLVASNVTAKQAKGGSDEKN